jgi:hypothetical protein
MYKKIYLGKKNPNLIRLLDALEALEAAQCFQALTQSKIELKPQHPVLCYRSSGKGHLFGGVLFP